MKKSWVIVANKSSARIFEQKKKNSLTLVECLYNPEAKVKEADIVSDRIGSSAQSNGHGHQSFSSKTSAKEYGEEVFAKEINDFLEKSRNKNSFKDLVVIAPPSFLGVIKKKLNKELSKQVVSYMNKDFSSKEDNEIAKLVA